MECSTLHSPSSLRASWDGIAVEYGRLEEVGEFDVAMPRHCVSVPFAPHDRVIGQGVIRFWHRISCVSLPAE